MAVKSEDRAPRSDGRVCKGFWNPTKDRVGVWKPQSCGLQGLSHAVSISSQEKSHLQKSTSSLMGKRPRHVVGCKARDLEIKGMAGVLWLYLALEVARNQASTLMYVCLKLGFWSTCQCEMGKEPWSYITLGRVTRANKESPKPCHLIRL